MSARETYFTAETIERKAREIQQQIAVDRNKQSIQFAPERAALLVLDMQSFFLDPASHAFIPSAPAILPGIQSLIEICAAHRLPIVFTRHVNTPQNAKRMSVWWRDLIVAESPLSAITPALDPSRGVVIVKSQYDAFYETPLEKILRERGISRIIICGVLTHLCCETTARSAFMRGFEVFFTIDGTATYTEAFHRASLLNLAHGFAAPVLMAEILAAMDRAQ